MKNWLLMFKNIIDIINIKKIVNHLVTSINNINSFVNHLVISILLFILLKIIQDNNNFCTELK